MINFDLRDINPVLKFPVGSFTNRNFILHKFFCSNINYDVINDCGYAGLEYHYRDLCDKFLEYYGVSIDRSFYYDTLFSDNFIRNNLILNGLGVELPVYPLYVWSVDGNNNYISNFDYLLSNFTNFGIVDFGFFNTKLAYSNLGSSNYVFYDKSFFNRRFYNCVGLNLLSIDGLRLISSDSIFLQTGNFRVNKNNNIIIGSSYLL